MAKQEERHELGVAMILKQRDMLYEHVQLLSRYSMTTPRLVMDQPTFERSGFALRMSNATKTPIPGY